MKAVVLVGGEGTRLRPLTETIPKPLVPLMDRASLDHVLDHLAAHGVHEVVLSSPYLERTFHAFVEARQGDPTIRWITETEPLGTGGAIVNALEALGDREPFLALNGDILTDLDLTVMIARHRERGAAATIALTHVHDARPFGLVPTEPDGRVIGFREKPTEMMPGDVNAGTYVLDPAALSGWERGRNASIEREIFPAMIADGRPVYGFVSHGYWIDLGTPESYLRAHFDILDGHVGFTRAYPAPYVAEGAHVDERARLGRWVVVGPGARIGPRTRVDDSVLLRGAVVGADSEVTNSIVGPRSSVGAWSVVVDSVLAEGAVVEPATSAYGARISAGGSVGTA